MIILWSAKGLCHSVTCVWREGGEEGKCKGEDRMEEGSRGGGDHGRQPVLEFRPRYGLPEVSQKNSRPAIL